MDEVLLRTLNLAFDVGHAALVVFVLTGWMVPAFRRYHLPVIAVVWASWLALGLWVGNLGYCVLTDWHWGIKERLGEGNLPPSFLEYMVNWVYPRDIDDRLISNTAALTLIAVTLVSATLHLRVRKRR